MTNLDEVLAQEYREESRDQLAWVETGLLALEKNGARIEEGRVDGIFRAVHSVRRGSEHLGLVKIGELAGRMETVLALIRSRKMVPTPERVRVLLWAADQLTELVQDPGQSDRQDIGEIVTALDNVGAGIEGPKVLRMLLVEDEFTSRLVMQKFLSRHGECHIAVNGKEAVEAFRSALAGGDRYGLICMDIMMPEMDGHEAVRRVRSLEEEQGILSSRGVKIIMTTALDDVKEVSRAFMELCDAYLVKPIDLSKLLAYMKKFQLVK